MLEMSLMAVVLPTPGLPSSRMDLPEKKGKVYAFQQSSWEPPEAAARSKTMILPDSTTSAAMFALPAIALPTRHVRPTICPSLLRTQLILCKHLSMPALLSPPKSLTCAAVKARVS